MLECTTAPRVLVADDQHDVLEALRLLLRRAGFAADCVSSVQSVRDRLRDGGYDLLLMDLNYARDTTSGREGLDLLAEVHADDELLPVVVMTGWGSVETAVEAMRLGARTFVQKPWDNTELTETIARAIAEGRTSRQTRVRQARELEQARLIQRALLPDRLPSLPGCELAVLWKPAGTFGGDCYDAVALGDSRVALSIGDVVGKGLPAALIMSHLQACTRAYGTDSRTPLDVVDRVNRSLCESLGLDTFVTFCYSVIDLERRTLTFTNAGHNPPILVRGDGTVIRLTAGGIVLGVMGAAPYEEGGVALQAGDRVVFFTDGLTEARGPDGSEFGDVRLVETVVAHRDRSAGRLLDAVFETVHDSAGGRLDDDATLLVLAVE